MTAILKKEYKFKRGHSTAYEYLYSIGDYRMFGMVNRDVALESDSTFVLTKDDKVIHINESQITLEAILVEELMDIEIKQDDIEFIDVALGIINSLSKVDPLYVGRNDKENKNAKTC